MPFGYFLKIKIFYHAFLFTVTLYAVIQRTIMQKLTGISHIPFVTVVADATSAKAFLLIYQRLVKQPTAVLS